MDFGIAGKTALVCGASKGLGFGSALALVQEGVNVVIVARGAEALEAAAVKLLAARAGGSAAATPWVKTVAADITTEAGRAAAFAVHSDFDIVVTNAGGPPPGDFRDWDREAWIKAVDANMLTPIELIKATVDGMAARADRHPRLVERGPQRAHRLRGRRGAHEPRGQGRDHQQPVAGRLRYRSAQGHHGRHRQEDRARHRRDSRGPAKGHSGGALRQP